MFLGKEPFVIDFLVKSYVSSSRLNWKFGQKLGLEKTKNFFLRKAKPEDSEDVTK